MADIYIWVSIGIWVLGIAFFVGGILLERRRQEKGKLNPLTWLIISTVAAIIIFYLYGNKDAQSGLLENLILAVLGGVRVITGDNSVVDTRAQMPEVSTGMASIFSLYTAVLHFMVSSVIIGFVLKLVDLLFPALRYRFLSRGRIYVFSGLSEREVLLAEDIRRLEKEKKGKASVMVFLGKAEEGQKEENVLKERIRKLGAFLFFEGVSELVIPKRCRKHRIDYFLLGEEDGKNINDALELAEKYKTEDTLVYVHVLSDYPETESLLDSVSDRGNCNFRLIPEKRTMLYQLLSKSPLFLGMKDDKLTILIVGAGQNGQEAVKICSWCGCMQDRVPEIWVLDQNERPYRQLLKECPETMREHVHYEVIDVCTPEFHTFLRSHREIGYVICALGDEHLNLRTAMDIRSIAYEEPPYDRESKKLPIINVRLNDDVLHRMAKSLKYDKDTLCELNPFGNLKEFYTWENIGASYLEGGGLAVHGFYKKLYGGKMTEQEIYEDYESSEYNRSSSMATALHGKYKAYACLGNIPAYDKALYDWGEQPDEKMCQKLAEQLYDIRVPLGERKSRVEKLARLEHDRWMAYTRSLGWRTAELKEASMWQEQMGTHKNAAAKLHPRLVEWENLDSYTQEHDRNLIWNLPFILYEALCYDDLLMGEQRKMHTDKTDLGMYSMVDFEAIVYWYDRPARAGEQIVIAGDCKAAVAYLRQALLLNIYAGSQASYEVRCQEEPEQEFLDGIERIGEQVLFYKDASVDGEKLKITRDGVSEQIEVKGQRVLEMRSELLRKGKAFNDYYLGQYGGSTWEELEPYKKASNICAAAFIGRHREAFIAGMDAEMMAEAEHERWNRFHYVNGWQYGAERDNSKKIHHCLVSYEQLGEEEKEKDRRNIELGLRIL